MELVQLVNSWARNMYVTLECACSIGTYMRHWNMHVVLEYACGIGTDIQHLQQTAQAAQISIWD